MSERNYHAAHRQEARVIRVAAAITIAAVLAAVFIPWSYA